MAWVHARERADWLKVAWLAAAIRNPWLREEDRQTPEELLGLGPPKDLDELLNPASALEAGYARQEALRRGTT